MQTASAGVPLYPWQRTHNAVCHGIVEDVLSRSHNSRRAALPSELRGGEAPRAVQFVMFGQTRQRPDRRRAELCNRFITFEISLRLLGCTFPPWYERESLPKSKRSGKILFHADRGCGKSGSYGRTYAEIAPPFDTLCGAFCNGHEGYRGLCPSRSAELINEAKYCRSGWVSGWVNTSPC